MQTLMQLLLIAAVVALLLAVTGVLLVRHAVRRVRRTARLWLLDVTARRAGMWSGGQVRASTPSELSGPAGDALTAITSGTALSARAWLPGPGREVAAVRRDLHRDMTGTSRAVAAGRAAGRPVHDLEWSLSRLAEQARALDVDLVIIAAEPDRIARRRLLEAHAERVTLIRRACAEVRGALLLGGSAANDADLNAIVEDINHQVTALDLRARAYRDLSRL